MKRLHLTLAVACCVMAGAAAIKTCKTTTTVKLPGVTGTVTSCVSFHTGTIPVLVRADTNFTKYGTIDRDMYSDKLVFTDRNGQQYQLSATAKVPLNTSSLDALRLTGQAYGLIVVASINKQSVAHSVRTYVHVPFSTMLSPYRNTQFIASVSWLAPPATLAETTAFIRWDFGGDIAITGAGKLQTRLLGNFTNLLNATRDGSQCQKALCSTKAACDLYTSTFGSTQSINMYWDPAMHRAGDSELVGTQAWRGLLSAAWCVEHITEMLRTRRAAWNANTMQPTARCMVPCGPPHSQVM